jgi:DNA-binding response OmpR family regulator
MPASSETKPKILVIEDDRSLRQGLAMSLGLAGYDVLTAADGDEGMRLAFDRRPDLIVLDIMLPGCNGLDILRELRKRGESVPVLVLSALDSISQKVRGLDVGADDYMAKPFDLKELLARINVMLRRRRAESQEGSELSAGPLCLDIARRRATVDGKALALSAKEFDLLRLLVAAPGQVFTRERIIERVWGWGYEGTERTVDNVMARLRQKLGNTERVRDCLHTVPCVGYKFELPSE